MDNMLPPGSHGLAGELYLLGTDDQGRDMLSAIIYGLRLSLFVGVIATAIALVLGTSVGTLAAYFGGRIDAMLMRLVDIQLSFPAILIALILLAILGKGVDKVVIALVSVQWAYYARTIRGSALSSAGANTSRRRMALRSPAGASSSVISCRTRSRR